MIKTYLASVATGALVLALTTAANAAVRRNEPVTPTRPALERYAEPACSLDGQFDGKGYCFFQSGTSVRAARAERPSAVAY